VKRVPVCGFEAREPQEHPHRDPRRPIDAPGILDRTLEADAPDLTLELG
jgi:hypothetical protein